MTDLSKIGNYQFQRTTNFEQMLLKWIKLKQIVKLRCCWKLLSVAVKSKSGLHKSHTLLKPHPELFLLHWEGYSYLHNTQVCRCHWRSKKKVNPRVDCTNLTHYSNHTQNCFVCTEKDIATCIISKTVGTIETFAKMQQARKIRGWTT